MLKLLNILCLALLITYSTAKLLDSERESSDKDYLNQELDKIDNSLNKELLNEVLNRPRFKRSDIDSRLMELQAKIDLVKAYQQMPAGHGKFDFDKIGKRFLDPIKFFKQQSEQN